MLDRTIRYIILAQLSFAIFLWLAVGHRLHNVIPQRYNATEWSDFSNKIVQELNAPNTTHRVWLLMTVHSLNFYCCLPMVHQTKFFYGYWLGLWTGSIVCVIWELTLLAIFLQFLQKDESVQTTLQAYILVIRQKRCLSLEIFMVSFSCVPLYTKTLLIRFSDVTNSEYLCSNIVPILIQSIMHIFCGSVMMNQPTLGNIILVCCIINISLVLHNIATVLVVYQTLLMLWRSSASQHSFRIPITYNNRQTKDVFETACVD